MAKEEKEIKVSKVVITIKDKDVVLTLDDARKLKSALDELFKVEVHTKVEREYIPYRRWYDPFYPTVGLSTVYGSIPNAAEELQKNFRTTGDWSFKPDVHTGCATALLSCKLDD